MNTPGVEEVSSSRPIVPSDDVDARLGRMTRRGFATAGVSLLSGYGAWRWLLSREPEEGLIWPLRRVLRWNERLASAAFGPSRLAPDFPRTRAQEPRVNGVIGMSAEPGGVPGLDAAGWRLKVVGGQAEGINRDFDLGDLKALPEVRTDHGVEMHRGLEHRRALGRRRLADLAAASGLAPGVGTAIRPGSPS